MGEEEAQHEGNVLLINYITSLYRCIVHLVGLGSSWASLSTIESASLPIIVGKLIVTRAVKFNLWVGTCFSQGYTIKRVFKFPSHDQNLGLCVTDA